VNTPFVYIVGAGPGDPALISVRGQRCLQAADVIVYDHRVHARLLRVARHDAERIDVGPAAPKPLEQDAICFLLAEKAREGRTVVRLKWGDPFVFDSGGKEALFLHEQGIPFEVVPGVPAAIGIPGYAGVPVTYAGGGDALTLVRGHEDESQTAPQIDWASLAKLKGTVVCYAGSRQLGAVLDALLSHGRPRSEHAAVIVNGTLPSQRTIDGSLEELAALVKESPIGLPAILVVGRVAGLREHLFQPGHRERVTARSLHLDHTRLRLRHGLGLDGERGELQAGRLGDSAERQQETGLHGGEEQLLGAPRIARPVEIERRRRRQVGHAGARQGRVALGTARDPGRVAVGERLHGHLLAARYSTQASSVASRG